jgi:hypothetical protein
MNINELARMDFKDFVRRGCGYVYRRLNRDGETVYYSNEEIESHLNCHRIKNLALLVDGSTETEALKRLRNVSISGIYTFSLDAFESGAQALLSGKQDMNHDGWLVSSTNPMTFHALSQFLHARGLDYQVILNHTVLPTRTRYYSNIDFFHGEQTTSVYLANYYDRCYRMLVPLPLRFKLRDEHGTVHRAGQIILPPGGMRVLTSSELCEHPFKGYLEVEFEIPTKVQPFLHYWADYFSKEAIATNHQSGLGTHPSFSRFPRGYVPTESDLTMDICLFQKDYAVPIEVTATLYYNGEDGSHKVSKVMPPLHRHQMLFVDAKELFHEIDFSKIRAPRVEIQSPQPLHRPNFYYRRCASSAYYDVNHAGPDYRIALTRDPLGKHTLTAQERSKIRSLDCTEFSIGQLVFPESTEVETFIAFGDELSHPVKRFRVEYFQPDGNLSVSFEEDFDYDQHGYFCLNQILRSRGITNLGGSVYLRPLESSPNLPSYVGSVAAYKHKRSNYLTSSAGYAGMNNMLFYFRRGPANSLVFPSTAAYTDLFVRGVFNKDLDTWFGIGFPSEDRKLKKTVEYEVQIVNPAGHRKSIYRKLPVNGSHFLKFSELLSEVGWDDGFYSVWFCCSEAQLFINHLLMRPSDGAISLEHSYLGRFGQ